VLVWVREQVLVWEQVPVWVREMTTNKVGFPMTVMITRTGGYKTLQ
jgi:hypothetical protein